MKNILLLFLLFCIAKPQQAQDNLTTYKVVTFMTNQSFYLNGGARAMFGGKSRVPLLITLPPNTVEWYYAITTTPNQNNNVSIGLAPQLMKLLDPTRGLASSAIASLIAPTGSGACDIYLVNNQQDLEKFISKQSETPPSIYSGTRQNFKEGVVPIRDATSGSYFLAFRNPSGSTGINVSVEVAAIVAEKTLAVKSSEQQKGELYGSLGWKAYQGGDYDKCLELSKKALEFDNSLSWVQCNIALVYLVTNKSQATDEYVKAIDLIKRSPRARDYLAAAIKDIDDARLAKGPIKDVEIIRSLLWDKYKRYTLANR